MTDPFEEERLRREQLIDQADRERMRALDAEEASPRAVTVHMDPDKIYRGSVRISPGPAVMWGPGQQYRDYFAQHASDAERDDQLSPFEIIGATVIEKQVFERREAERKKREREAQERLNAELERLRQVRIGGWNVGDPDQTHQAVRFEIEAERALFLGKPTPKDEKLAVMHQALADLHSAYQRTGDTSLLIAIADQSAKYQAELTDSKRNKNRK